MAWYLKNNGDLWTGDTHTLHGSTWTEKNHMSYSTKVEKGEEPVSARTETGAFKADDPSTPLVNESKKKQTRKKKAK